MSTMRRFAVDFRNEGADIVCESARVIVRAASAETAAAVAVRYLDGLVTWHTASRAHVEPLDDPAPTRRIPNK